MKLEQLIVQFLYQHKRVSIQDIGIFTISPEVTISTENEKESALPPGSIHFEFDAKAQRDDALIDYITQQTRKIKPLATSDLESYSILGKQFLNIGKPLLIEGLGTLHKSQQGEYEFKQGNTSSAKLQSGPPRITEKESEEISFRSPEKRNPVRKKQGLLMVFILVIVLGAGAIVFYMLRHRDNDQSLAMVPAHEDTVIPAAPKQDMVAPVKDTLTTALPDSAQKVASPATGGYDFSVVIKEYATKAAAEKALARLTSYGHKLILSPIDSVRYKLAMPFNRPLSDTVAVIDSLNKFFNTKSYLDHK